jgi:acetyl/propionyl-CoA carboxylase alpha subunit
MTGNRVLIANRGEVAVRVARAVRELGWTSIGVHGRDEPSAPHLRHCHEQVELAGQGAAAYLDVGLIITTARAMSVDFVHPGYGFLAESPELSEACEQADMSFVGPGPSILRTLGDKVAARTFAADLGLPVLPGVAITDAAAAESLLAELGPEASIIVKAIGGGGGRGIRVVGPGGDMAAALERSRSEALAAFGRDDLYAEQLVPRARHIEIQLVGDGARVVALGERECTLQRRHQKLVEVAPSPSIDPSTRQRLVAHAVALGAALDLRGLATVEFLLGSDDEPSGWFIEANPRLQVEHAVTEAVWGLDLVRTQLLIASGRKLDEIGLAEPPSTPRGAAVQVRVNTETIGPDGSIHPTSGTIIALSLPAGPGIRCDTAAHVEMTTNPSFDSMLVKVIAHAENHDAARRRVVGALGELNTTGVETNAAFLRALMSHPEVVANRIDTTFVSDRASELIATLPPAAETTIDPADPLAVLDHGRAPHRPPTPSSEPVSAPASAGLPRSTAAMAGPADSEPVGAPVQGTIVSIGVTVGDLVAEGAELVVMEAMKMEHVVGAPTGGIVRLVTVEVGDAVMVDHPLVFLEGADVTAAASSPDAGVDLDQIRPDLQTVIDRHATGYDDHRREKVERRHSRGNRTARENLADLVDQGTFVEYGPLVVAAQRRRRSLEDLIENTPGDGLVGGIATVNGDLFDGHVAQTVVLSYDYMVLAGTQGMQNHRKKDRLFEIAEQQRLPVIVFTEGGGGRPGDTDTVGGSGLDCLAFMYFAGLSGHVPLIGINNGPCFAGNAALLGCCDVVIATANSSIGMGGPAMIEGGGLGIYHPDEVGPLSTQVPNGVVDVAVTDEAEAVAVAKQYLAYFQGALDDWDCADQRLLRHAIPENRLRIYDVRRVIETMFDTGSVLELRSGWGHGMVTALARVEGRPIGVIANNPTHLAGAIDADGADKASRFMQLCDAHDLPIVMLCDTPGIMVGPAAEKEATVRHAARMFVTGASLDVPLMTIVLRKGYGLGAQAMAGASFHAGLFTISWPTGEFGGMGLEGFVKLGYRKELEAIADPAERQRHFEEMVADMYDVGHAVNNATTFEIDDVIDPLESRRWIATALRSTPPRPPRTTKKRPMIDTW